MPSALADIFAADGVLAYALTDYRPRDGQIEMAQQVEKILLAGGQSVLEAGTGIGKTFAYLTPIIQSGMTGLISTGARALQDQLSQRDIPLLAQALGRNVSLAVLKGRANYICKQAIASPVASGELFGDEKSHWREILDFSARSEDGDIRGITALPSDSRLLKEAVSTRESCNPQTCEYYKECFLYKARARAMNADIVIVNHHLFLSDMRLRDEGVAELLPSRDVVLFDEAHILPQLAPQFFGEHVSDKMIMRFINEVERYVQQSADDGRLQAVPSATAAVREALAGLLEATNNQQRNERQTADVLLADEHWRGAALRLYNAMLALGRMLRDNAGLAEKFAAYAVRAMSDTAMMQQWLAEAMDNKEEAQPKEDKEEQADEVPLVRWADLSRSGLVLHSAPMSGRALFARQWQQLPTVLFTSATLSVGGDFRDFCEETGLETEHTYSWDSPYDFASRSLLYLPPNLPSPADAEEHTTAVAQAALPLIRANGGRAFVLFSSWRALNSAYRQLQPLLEQDGIDVLKQGDMPNDELLRCFRESQRAVLIGSQSFWQGVDVRGEALSLLVVDKIPFTPPTDPLLMARDAWRKQRGENAFIHNQLPPAVLLMKQAAGRLIRDYDDYGVFMIGDPRIRTKGYGKTIHKALPPMPLCTSGEQAAAFLQRFSTQAATGSKEQ